MAECRIPGHITGLYIFAVVNLCALLNISLVSADVFVIDVDKNSTIDVMQDKQAMFGTDFPAEGLMGRLVYVIPHDACNKVHPPPSDPSEMDLPWIALIKRGPCHFDLKVLNAQSGNFSAAIVHNSVGDNSLVQMAGGEYADQVKIPSVFVGYDNGMLLAHSYNYTHKSIVIKILESSDQAPASFFLPFVVVVSICFLGVIVFSIIKCVKYLQHIRRTRLSKSALKKIPTRKYKKGDHYDTCAICLEDYEEGEKLRVLPCDHTYHCKCIDPWLTKRKKTCPQCKRRVIPGHETDSDSDGGEEDNGSSGGGASETTPLLSGGNNNNHRRPGPSGRQSRRSGQPSSSAAVAQEAGAASPSDLPALVQPEVVVINEGRMAVNTTTVSARGARADDSSSTEEEEEGEELQGAVGGVGISDRKDFDEDRPSVVVEVEPSRHSFSPSPAPGAAAVEQQQQQQHSAEDHAPSPVGGEGSINGAFVASASSEEDNTQGSGSSSGSGSGSGRGGKKKKKQKQQQQQQRKNNQVV